MALALTVLLGVSIGCGSKSMTPPQNPEAVAITVQPANQAVRLGETASFRVTVAGSNPSFQWSKNGVDISGAAGAMLTIPITAPEDNNSRFTVAIKNSVSSVTSRPATLVLNAPKPGDLRFQQVDSDVTLNGYIGFEHTNISNRLAQTRTDYGSPLELSPFASACGPGIFNCDWSFSFFDTSSPGSLTSGYQDNAIEGFAADVAALGPDTVVTSMDLQRANDIYAVSWIKGAQSSGFAPLVQSVAPADLQATAGSLAAESQVITGIAFDSGNITVLSYSWQGDPSTTYEAKVVSSATLDAVPTAAASLAGEGYFITAVGGHVDDGFLLVGTRVEGDAMPRAIKIVLSPAQDVKDEFWGQGYALITSFPNASDTAQTWIGEK